MDIKPNVDTAQAPVRRMITIEYFHQSPLEWKSGLRTLTLNYELRYDCGYYQPERSCSREGCQCDAGRIGVKEVRDRRDLECQVSNVYVRQLDRLTMIDMAPQI